MHPGASGESFGCEHSQRRVGANSAGSAAVPAGGLVLVIELRGGHLEQAARMHMVSLRVELLRQIQRALFRLLPFLLEQRVAAFPFSL